jgi:hypothetical protein
VAGLDKDFLGLAEIPAINCSLELNLHLSIIEVLLPLIKDIDTLINGSYGLILLGSKDASDVDLAADLVANFIRDAFKKVFHLIQVLADVTGDGPNELQAIKERRKSLFNDCELSS